ncbi:hypothetical protein SAMD00023353_0602660 [Rosellinia necatrix]|uniref:Uncharacterized protein n=1 Tax=Rosellinia necatrix TaxID=77044 RepID=A0A1S7ULM7_ROSNE|nr:hypothetical protein SAMD00023353_0602660 [Rosellinia necatrix]
MVRATTAAATAAFAFASVSAAAPLTTPPSAPATDYSSLTCPAGAFGTLPTPTYGGRGALFTVCSGVAIGAAAPRVRDAVLDFRGYARWNSFVVAVTGLPANVTRTPRDDYVGMPMTFTSAGLLPAGLNATSAEVLTVLSGAGVGSGEGGGEGAGRPYLLVAWRYDDSLAGVGARAEHAVVIVERGPRSSWVLSYETFYAGLLTPAIALLKGRQQAQFDAQAADLKAYVEGMAWRE